jgi:hypothetical protein
MHLFTLIICYLFVPNKSGMVSFALLLTLLDYFSPFHKSERRFSFFSGGEKCSNDDLAEMDEIVAGAVASSFPM